MPRRFPSSSMSSNPSTDSAGAEVAGLPLSPDRSSVPGVSGGRPSPSRGNSLEPPVLRQVDAGYGLIRRRAALDLRVYRLSHVQQDLPVTLKARPRVAWIVGQEPVSRHEEDGERECAGGYQVGNSGIAMPVGL